MVLGDLMVTLDPFKSLQVIFYSSLFLFTFLSSKVRCNLRFFKYISEMLKDDYDPLTEICGVSLG